MKKKVSAPPPVMRDKKILIVTDSFRLRTGFATVGRHLADHIMKNMPTWEVRYLGWFDKDTDVGRSYRLYSTSKGQHQERDKYAMMTFPAVIDDYKPDIVWACGDVWMLNTYCDVKTRDNFRLIYYIPIDGWPVPKKTLHGAMHIDWPHVFRSADELVAYGPFGQKGINARCKEEICKKWIPHGVDTNTYTPLDPYMRNQIRTRTFNLPPNAFMIGAFSRNQPRKAYDRVLRAFKLALEKEDPSRPMFLYFHCAIHDVGWLLEDIAEDLGILHRVIFNHKLQIGVGYSDWQLNQIYNACDATILPARGEGFGLTIIESMSAGVPVITTNYSGQSDFTDKGCLHPEILAMDCEPLTNIERAVVDIPDMSEKILTLYNDRQLRLTLGAEARDKALEYDWENICKQWEDLIESQPIYKNLPYATSDVSEEKDVDKQKDGVALTVL